MDKNRLRFLAGMPLIESVTKPLMESMGTDEIQDMAYRLFQAAEADAANDAADQEGRGLHGDAIWRYYEELKGQLDHYVSQAIEGNHGGSSEDDMMGGEDSAAMMDRGMGMRDEPDDFEDYEDKYGE